MWWRVVAVIALVDLGIQLTSSSIEMQRNVGVGFGLFQGIPVWLIFAFFVLYILWIYLKWSELGRLSRRGIILILAGGLSNMVSRIVMGSVGDYLIVGEIGYNLSDLLIIVGLGAYFVSVMKFRRGREYVADSNSF